KLSRAHLAAEPGAPDPAHVSPQGLVEQGALFSYGPDFVAVGQDIARYVDRILKGAKPADLPVQQVARLELVINLKTAKELGLTIPQTLLLRADQGSRVQRKAGATSGCQSRRGKSQTPRSLDSRVEGNRDSEAYRQ